MIKINKAADMNDLPNELLFSIFKHLKIKDFPQCRLVKCYTITDSIDFDSATIDLFSLHKRRQVCKRFLRICDEIIIPELVISNTIENIKEYWFPTNEQYNHKDAIDVVTFKACRSRFQFDKFLKRLHLKCTYADYKELNLNDLIHIEQLTIDIDFDRSERNPVIDISLPNLKMLHDRCGFFFVLRVNAPKLEMLKCDDFRLTPIHLNHPHTVNYLELDYYYESAASLKNVKYLKVGEGYEKIRSAHPELVHLVCNYRFADEDDDEDGVERNVVAVNAIRQLIKKRGRQMKIYFQSVELENVYKIEEYDPDNHLAFQINNYDSLGDNIFCYQIQYNELMDMVKGNLPNNFYKKYFNIRAIAVTGNVKDADHLMGFLKHFEYLDTLSLDSSSFDQSFFDFLPLIDQLTSLDLNESSKCSKSITSYDFLFKFTRLKDFTTDRDSPDFFNLTVALFGQLKHLELVCFCYKKYFLSIYQESTNSYNFRQEVENEENGTNELLFDKLDIVDLGQFFKWFIGII